MLRAALGCNCKPRTITKVLTPKAASTVAATILLTTLACLDWPPPAGLLRSALDYHGLRRRDFNCQMGGASCLAVRHDTTFFFYRGRGGRLLSIGWDHFAEPALLWKEYEEAVAQLSTTHGAPYLCHQTEGDITIVDSRWEADSGLTLAIVGRSASSLNTSIRPRISLVYAERLERCARLPSVPYFAMNTLPLRGRQPQTVLRWSPVQPQPHFKAG